MHADSPLQGKIGALVGMPDEATLNHWREKAGMSVGVYSLGEANNDTMFGGGEEREVDGVEDFGFER